MLGNYVKHSNKCLCKHLLKSIQRLGFLMCSQLNQDTVTINGQLANQKANTGKSVKYGVNEQKWSL